MTPAQILRRAADLIEERGIALLPALAIAAPGPVQWCEIQWDVATRAGIRNRLREIERWSATRTAEQVLAVLRGE